MKANNEDYTETKRFPYFKLLLGVLAVAIICFGAFSVEKAIGNTVRDVNIKKSSLSTDKVTFRSVKPLDTKIMAVIASDGTVRLAFDDCLSCYYNDGVRAHYTDTGTSVVCDNCGCETMYDDLGVLSYECTPYPILSDYIYEDDTTLEIRKDFLEECKDMLGVLRSGKGNYATVYPESDYMNMEITEGGDRAVEYDTSGEISVPQQPVTVDYLLNRTETITKLFNGYQDDVTMNSDHDDIAAFESLRTEFLDLCDELADSDIDAQRAIEINQRFDEMEAEIRELGQKAVG